MHKCYRAVVRIPFQHVDVAGVLFFARLFEHAHQVYEGFMEAIDWPLPRLLEEGALMLPIVHAEADYRSPIRYGDRLEAVMSVIRIGTGSYTLSCCFEKERARRDLQGKGGIAAEVRTVHASLSLRSGPCPLPETLCRALVLYSEQDASISD